MIYGIKGTECEELSDEELKARIGDLWQKIQVDRSKWSFDMQEAESLLNEAKRRRKGCNCGVCSKCRNKEPAGQILLNLYPPS